MGYRNLTEMQRAQALRLGRMPALRHKQDGLYRDVPWRDYREMTEACALAFIDAGVKPGDRIGMVAENCVEWLVADMGILAAGAVNVPMHAPMTAKQIQFQLAETGANWVIVSGVDQLAKVTQIQGELPELKGVIAFEGPYASDVEPWHAWLQRGRRARQRLQSELEKRESQLEADALATIMYTSGTTANPKGVMLTHGNLLSNAVAFDQASPRPGGVMLNWLPLSHIYARTVDHYLSQVSGVTLCLAVHAETVITNLRETHPTHLSAVPRFYEKVLAAVHTNDRDKMQQRLRFIFGTRMDWLGSGGAPLPLALAKAYQEAGILLLQGYGLTESSPVISFNRKDKYKLGSVGAALPGVEIKIAEDGEVLARGPNIMQGYWNNPQATREALQDGWLYTGDLGSLDDEGFLSITGRKKELLVLSNGKKVLPNQIECLLVSDPFIDQAVVDGEGHNYLTALIVPNWDAVRKQLDGEHSHLPVEALAEERAVHDLLNEHIDRALVDMCAWEKIKRFAVLAEPFSVDREELTVSMKLRRSVIIQRYHDKLESLYRGE